MKCPFMKEIEKTPVEEIVTGFGNCYMETCMAYREIKVNKNESICYCALMATPNIPYSFGGCYDGNN